MNGHSWTDAIPLVRAVYQRPRGGTGCCLHIITDDGNIDQSFADSVVASARERGHPECIAAAEMLARMSRTQRGRVYKHYDQYAGSVFERFPFLKAVPRG